MTQHGISITLQSIRFRDLALSRSPWELDKGKDSLEFQNEFCHSKVLQRKGMERQNNYKFTLTGQKHSFERNESKYCIILFGRLNPLIPLLSIGPNSPSTVGKAHSTYQLEQSSATNPAEYPDKSRGIRRRLHPHEPPLRATWHPNHR